MTWRPGPAWLFCPADRPDRYGKALGVGDVVVVDLEDAVAADRKAMARDAVMRAQLDPDRVVLRINGSGTADHRADVLLAREAGMTRVMLAKAEEPISVAALAPLQVFALVESPLGLLRVAELAAVSNVAGLMWGADDLVAGLGGTASRHPDGRYRDIARHARNQTLLAAKAHQRLALDGVHMDIQDTDGLREECEDAAAIGFDATLAIHPSQLPVIRAAYAPTADRVQWAQALLAARADSGGVATFEGRMVDGPVYRQAQRLLDLHDRTREPDGSIGGADAP